MSKNNDLIVILFDINYRDPFSILCSLVTSSSYSHSAVCIDGKVYDNTFLRGHFDEVDLRKEHNNDRELTIIKIKGISGKEWLEKVKNDKLYPIKYDVLGLVFWPFGLHSKNREYCFETVNNCLSYYNRGAHRNNGRISAKYIFRKFINCKDTIVMRTNVANFEKNIKILKNI